MDPVDAVTTHLLDTGRSRGHDHELHLRLLKASQLDSGMVHLDYGDQDHVFLLTVQQIPRRTLGPAQPVEVGRIDGLDVHLSAVVIDNWIHVHLQVPASPLSDQKVREHEAAFQQWATARSQHRDDVPRPPWPAEQLRQITVQLRDDLGTTYRYATGEAGGSGTEWHAQQSFLPVPPPHARYLTVRFQAPGQDPVTTDLNLYRRAGSP